MSAAAGLDVFATEPTTDSPLFDLPQVVVTPHLGASTAEAQDRAGTDVAESVKLALAGEFVPDAVNVGGGVVGEEVAPWLDLVRKLGLLIGVLSAELPVSISVQVRGELAAEDVEVLRLSALRGLFSSVIEDPVTFVNAPALAAERGVEASISTATESPNHRSVVDVRAVCSDGQVANVAGTLSGPQQVEKVVAINGRNFDLRAEGINLIINYADQPGTLGKIGTLLGSAGVNIHAAQLSEDAEGASATILMRIDRDVPAGPACGDRRRRRRQPAGSGGPVVKLAVIAGDGIGPEVIGEALKVLDVVLPGVEKTEYDLGARRYHATGETLPDGVVDELKGHDAILLGAIGDPSVPSGVLERGLLLTLRFQLDHHVNHRPSRLYPGVDSPLAGNPPIDFVVVREGTEGPYTGTGGVIRVGTPHEVATEVSLNTAFGVERVARYAFALAADATQAPDAGAQDERADLRGQAVVAGGRRGGPGLPRHRGRLSAHRRGHHPHGDRSGPVRRDRHRQSVRRHHHRSGRRGVRRYRAGGQRQYRCDAHESVDVRAGARQRTRHRGSGHRRPDRGDHIRGPAAVACR